MRVDIFTIFTDMFKSPFESANIAIAQKRGLLCLKIWNLRDFAADNHRKVDDYPYGGGPGMILKPEPIFRGVRSILSKNSRVILLSPQGRVFNQRIARELSRESHLILICGHYKGVDERVRWLVHDEISIGEYILSGGEIPAIVLVDAVSRLIPGVIGDIKSAESDSFEDGFLDSPYYTRPEDFEGMRVPRVLLSGDHKKIEEWRKRHRRKK